MDIEKEIIITKILKNCAGNKDRIIDLKKIADELGIPEKQVVKTVNWLMSKNIPISLNLEKKNLISITTNLFDFLFSLFNKLGFSLTKIVRYLSWNDFERYISELLQKFDFQTYVNFRISVNKMRREVDIIAKRDNLILCIDAKHWNKRITQSVLLKIVENQKERCRLIAKSPYELFKIFRDLMYYDNVYLVPIIIELFESKTNFIDGVYVIPWIAINEFLLAFEVADTNLWKISIDPQKYKLL